ncbi:hypothetical protein CRUP_015830 [Coryphaenoides rupestris]|nr:hypothetical protein CRUP_015830 [Coryphaenoides rupestris]
MDQRVIRESFEVDDDRIYMDYNATTPLDPAVIRAVSEALGEAWGNPSSTNVAGAKAKALICKAREDVATMVGGRAEDIIFTSGGTEANNLVFHSVMEDFKRHSAAGGQRSGAFGGTQNGGPACRPHLIISNVEHDSIKLVAENLQNTGQAEVTCVTVSTVTGRVEVQDLLAAVKPNTCLVSVMLANNETGVIMPIRELCRKVNDVNQQRGHPRILVHTDAAQALGKICVDVADLGVDYLSIVGHKFYAPRIGALYVRGPGTTTPLHPMFYGGGQERSFRPGTENTPMIAGLGKAAELVTANLHDYESHLRKTRLHLERRLREVFGEEKLHFNSHFPGSETLPNTCNVSILGPRLQGVGPLSETAGQVWELPATQTLEDVEAAVEDLRRSVQLLES